jgi:hypothetical protein
MLKNEQSRTMESFTREIVTIQTWSYQTKVCRHLRTTCFFLATSMYSKIFQASDPARLKKLTAIQTSGNVGIAGIWSNHSWIGNRKPSSRSGSLSSILIWMASLWATFLKINELCSPQNLHSSITFSWTPHVYMLLQNYTSAFCSEVWF